jgi:hypothetical protein
MPRARSAPDWIATVPPSEALRVGPLGAHIGNVRVGTASWTEKTLVASGDFYPSVANTPEKRLRYYARHFSVVEVDATYYALPREQMAAAWAERTPADFRFGVKAYAAITEHPFEPSRLDRELQAALPPELRRARRVYPKDLPSEVSDEIFARFVRALAPLRDAGKLAYVFCRCRRGSRRRGGTRRRWRRTRRGCRGFRSPSSSGARTGSRRTVGSGRSTCCVGII